MAALLVGAGCASSQGSSSIPAAGVANSVPLLSRASVERDQAARCAAFHATFDERVACQRANGTLGSFIDHQITWRVRYFVRYQTMPCTEAPTVEEEYVFRMVTNDLYNDGDLNNAQRLAIRNAMFDGKVHCKE